jgi:putative two-component system response regulator
MTDVSGNGGADRDRGPGKGDVDEAAVKRARLLIVDDQESNTRLLESLLEVSGFTDVVSTTDSSRAVPLCIELEPDLLLLDMHMPPPDGLQVLAQLEPRRRGPARLPILVLTADTARETKRRALSLGASDFLHKPFDTIEAVLRIETLVVTRLLQVELEGQNLSLEARVRERTAELEVAQAEILERLTRAAEYRDDATGEHALRVGRIAALLARELGVTEETAELIEQAAPLHDVGKLAVSDAILLKRGDLTPIELEAMKLHAAIGAEILGGSSFPLLRLSEEIALSHHERWDGTGYPAGLEGERIPISGRIVAVADALDSLTHRRPHQQAVSLDQALVELQGASGTQFDPRVVDALFAVGRVSLEAAAGLIGEPVTAR